MMVRQQYNSLNHSNIDWKIHKGEMLGCLGMRSSGYFHVSIDTLQQIMKSSFKDNCSFLNEDETSEYFDHYNKDHKEVVNYIKGEVNKRLKQQGNTKLVDRNEHPVENDTNIVPDNDKGPYPWLDKDDPRRSMTDQETLEKYVDLSDSDLNAAEKKSLYKVLLKYKEAFSLRDEIGLCPNMEIELELNDDTPFFIRPFPIKESEKEVVDKKMRRGCLLGILKKGMSSYSSPIMLIPRKLTGIPRIVTDFRYHNSGLVTLQPSVPLVRDAIQILRKFRSRGTIFSRLKRCISHFETFKEITKVLWNNSLLWKSHLAIMDDILTYSKRTDHTGKLIDLFKAVIRNGLKMSPRKCKLFKKSLVFMGLTMMIEDGMVKMKPQKSRIEAILKVKPTTTVKECRSFCGMVNYMSIFLPSLQEKLIPVYFITRKGVPFY